MQLYGYIHSKFIPIVFSLCVSIGKLPILEQRNNRKKSFNMIYKII